MVDLLEAEAINNLTSDEGLWRALGDDGLVLLDLAADLEELIAVIALLDHAVVRDALVTAHLQGLCSRAHITSSAGGETHGTITERASNTLSTVIREGSEFHHEVVGFTWRLSKVKCQRQKVEGFKYNLFGAFDSDNLLEYAFKVHDPSVKHVMLLWHVIVSKEVAAENGRVVRLLFSFHSDQRLQVTRLTLKGSCLHELLMLASSLAQGHCMLSAQLVEDRWQDELGSRVPSFGCTRHLSLLCVETFDLRSLSLQHGLRSNNIT